MKPLWLSFALWLIVMSLSTQAQTTPDPIVTETTLKSSQDSVSKLNLTLVSTYKKFNQALKEKRLNTFDDSTDYALLHYKTLTESRIPKHLQPIMKRNLGAALMERELAVMKEAREKGKGHISRDEKVLLPAIANLKEALQLFEATDYLFPFLKARIAVLESQLPPKPVLLSSQTVDKNIQDAKEITQKYNLHTKELLLKSLALEPKMVSTYALLASVYRNNQQFDSANYYQEKVVEQLPNQGYAYLNLALNYEAMPYTDAQNRPAPHPKALANFEKAIALDPSLQEAVMSLGNLYTGLQHNKYGERQMVFDKAYRNYPKAIFFLEKIVEPNELGELIEHWKTLYFLHKANGDKTKAKVYLKKILQKAKMGKTSLSYVLVARKMVEVFEWSEDDADLEIAFDLQLKALKKGKNELKSLKSPDSSQIKAVKTKYFPATEKK
jgi:Tfp pilus assembly protein PilF